MCIIVFVSHLDPTFQKFATPLTGVLAVYMSAWDYYDPTFFHLSWPNYKCHKINYRIHKALYEIFIFLIYRGQIINFTTR
jgi:hypothetical protein